MKKNSKKDGLENVKLNLYNPPKTRHLERGLCMKGSIYPYKKGYMVRFGRDVSKWFKSNEQAERFLTGLRYEVDKGTFDIRD